MYRLRRKNTNNIIPYIAKSHEGWSIHWFNRFFIFKLSDSEKVVPTITMKVYLKTIRGRFYCYQTIRGQDYSFNSKTEEGARKQMIRKIKQLYSVSGRLDVTLDITRK